MRWYSNPCIKRILHFNSVKYLKHDLNTVREILKKIDSTIIELFNEDEVVTYDVGNISPNALLDLKETLRQEGWAMTYSSNGESGITISLQEYTKVFNADNWILNELHDFELREGTLNKNRVTSLVYTPITNKQQEEYKKQLNNTILVKRMSSQISS